MDTFYTRTLTTTQEIQIQIFNVEDHKIVCTGLF